MIKIIDIDDARAPLANNMNEVIGTEEYRAPEVVSGLSLWF